MLKLKISKDLLQRWQDRIAWVQSANFAAYENEEVKATRIARARKDYNFFVYTYFAHLAECKNAKFQTEAAEVIKLSKNIRLLLEWARGHAKSSHASLMIPLWLLFQEVPEMHFMVLVSKSQDAAIRLLSDLQAELQYNEKIKADFGNQVTSGSWTEGEFVTTGGCMFLALGRGQSPRGLKNRGKRPDYIVIDDIDDDELIRNPRRVKDVINWVKEALFGSMQGGRGRFVMVGNRIGKDSVLSRFAALKKVQHTIVNMLDKKGRPSWPENYTPKEIHDIREFMGERSFQKEYMNNPITEGTVFTEKDIKYGKMLELKEYRSLICYTDPSWKSNEAADFKATILVGKTKSGEYHILKAYADQCSVSEMVRWHYEIHAYINGRVPVLYWMEANFMQDSLLNEFKKVGNSVGHHIAVRGDVRKKPDKFARIEALQPLFERRLVVFNDKEKDSDGMAVLNDQLLMFEKGMKVNDDAPDALEGAIWKLDKRTESTNTTYRTGRRESRKY